jgi:chromosome segregation ATPase
MPARAARRPVFELPYGRRGVFQGYAAKLELGNLQARTAELSAALDAARASCDRSTAARREETSRNGRHFSDFEDVKRYLSLKIRDKERKIRFYQNKLKETRQEREDLIAKLQAEHDSLKQAHELELTQLTNTLKASKQRRDALATVAALEIQLRREIEEAEQTLRREKAQQSLQTSTALADYYALHVRHERELADGIEREKAKNRKMTAEHLEHTVIEMMREIDSEMKRLSALVVEARKIADVNSQLMKLNKQRYMERDLLQQECDAAVAKINRNDQKIRRLVEELRIQDGAIAGGDATATIEEVDERPPDSPREAPEPQEQAPEAAGPDREAMLQNFFESSVEILCRAVVEILAVIDPPHAEDYRGFHGVFDAFEGRKKELRFLMSKLGNLSFDPDDREKLPDVGFADIEGVDQDVAAKRIVEPQRKAFLEFAQPVGEAEFPELIATHFFQ